MRAARSVPPPHNCPPAREQLFAPKVTRGRARRQVTFLYKFVAGVSQESYGLHCAQAAGLPVRVVERAAQHKEAMQLAGGGRALRQLALFKALADLLAVRRCVVRDIHRLVPLLSRRTSSVGAVINASSSSLVRPGA